MAATVDTAANPQEPVPLDTIPISPEGGNMNGTKDGEAGSVPYNDSEPVTVFHDPNNFNVKHPLMNAWTLWFTKPPSGKGDNWNELLKEVISFDSVEEFWGIYNNITSTSQLALKSDYHLFKKGVRPEWEDPQNKHGGKWSFSFRDKKLIDIDSLWLHVMLAAIGETLEDEGDGEVMGVVVNVRKGFYRIGLWTRTVGKPFPGGGDGNNAGGKGRSFEQGKEVLMKIGHRFKEALGLKENDQVEFSGHTDSAHSGSTRAKAKFVV
ncbi:eukaryotic translation initiation factor 4E [Botryosphaeria dothidea]